MALAAVQALGRYREGLEPLSEWLADKELQLEVRKAAASALGELGLEEAADALLAALRRRGMPPTLRQAMIDTIMAANPGLDFVLIGDTGQHDVEVYTAVAEQHPGRVLRVILRAAGPDMDARDRLAARDLARLNVPVSIGPDYRKLRRVRSE